MRHCPRPAGGLGEVRLALRKEAPALTHPPGPAPQHQLCVGAPTRAPQDQRPCAVGRGAGGTRAWTPQRLTAPYKLPRCMGDGGEVPTNVCIVPCSETGLAPPLPLPGAQGSLAPPASFPSSGLRKQDTPSSWASGHFRGGSRGPAPFWASLHPSGQMLSTQKLAHGKGHSATLIFTVLSRKCPQIQRH